MKRLRAAIISIALLAAGGCVSRAPTIAHVHIGHAITGVHVTPNKEGYLVTAERRAAEAVDFAHALPQATISTRSRRKWPPRFRATDTTSNTGMLTDPRDPRMTQRTSKPVVQRIET